MKKCFLILILFVPTFINAQLYYYEQINKARYCAYKTDYKKALEYYDELIRAKADTSGVIMTLLSRDPIYWAFAAIDYKQAYKLILKKVDHLESCTTIVAANKYLGDSIINKLKETKYYKKYLKHNFHKPHDQIYKYSWQEVNNFAHLLSIDFIDGEIRIFNYKKWGRNIDSAELSRLGIELYRFSDSVNINHFFRIVRENNNQISFRLFEGNYINILHNIHHCNLLYLKSVWYYDSFVYYFKPAVQKYWYENKMYANLIDNANCGYCDSLQIYGTKFDKKDGVRVIRKGIIDIENVDKRRAEIGLPTLYESSIYDKFILPEGYKIPEQFQIK